MPYKLSIFSIMIITLTVQAQPVVEFLRTYGGNTQDNFYDIYAVSNGDYVMCGYSGDSIWVIRIDDSGNEIWSNVYGYRRAYSIIETDQGNFLIGGDAGEKTAILIDSDGEIIWRRYYGSGAFNAVIELKSSEFLLTGYSYMNNVGTGYLAMINGDGDLMWDYTYPRGEQNSEFYAMRETDGGTVLAGSDTNTYSGLLVKIDIENQGEVIWTRSYEEIGSFRSITSVQGGGICTDRKLCS